MSSGRVFVWVLLIGDRDLVPVDPLGSLSDSQADSIWFGSGSFWTALLKRSAEEEVDQTAANGRLNLRNINFVI